MPWTTDTTVSTAAVLFDAVISYFLFRVGRSTSRIDAAEQRREAAFGRMSEDLHAANEKLLDERFRAISHRVREETQAATGQMHSLGMEAKKLEERITQIITALPQREFDGHKELGNSRTNSVAV